MVPQLHDCNSMNVSFMNEANSIDETIKHSPYHVKKYIHLKGYLESLSPETFSFAKEIKGTGKKAKDSKVEERKL